jgi:hypothetical protein
VGRHAAECEVGAVDSFPVRIEAHSRSRRSRLGLPRLKGAAHRSRAPRT